MLKDKHWVKKIDFLAAVSVKDIGKFIQKYRLNMRPKGGVVVFISFQLTQEVFFKRYIDNIERKEKKRKIYRIFNKNTIQ